MIVLPLILLLLHPPGFAFQLGGIHLGFAFDVISGEDSGSKDFEPLIVRSSSKISTMVPW